MGCETGWQSKEFPQRRSVNVTDVSSPLWRMARWWRELRVVSVPLRVELHVVVRHDADLEVVSAPLNPVG